MKSKTSNYYYDEKEKKHIFRAQETYKGVKMKLLGTSRISKSEAKQKFLLNREKQIEAIEHGIDVKAGREKLKDAMRIWYDRYLIPKVTHGRARKQSTIDTDMMQLNQIWDALGDINVCDIESDMIQDYFNTLASDGKAERIRRGWLLLSQFCRYARPRDNPMLACTKPQAKPKCESEASCEKAAYDDNAMEALTSQLLSSPSGKNHEQAIVRGQMLCTIMWQFLRIGEAQELRVKDIDLENNIIRITRQYDEARKEVSAPKDNSIRQMPISAKCHQVLVRACAGKDLEALVFPGDINNLHGGRTLRTAARNTLTAACAAVNLDRHTLHDLRHDGISYYVRAGASPQAIQRWAGHRSIQVTLEVYYRDTGIDSTRDTAIMAGVASQATDQDKLLLNMMHKAAEESGMQTVEYLSALIAAARLLLPQTQKIYYPSDLTEQDVDRAKIPQNNYVIATE